MAKKLSLADFSTLTARALLQVREWRRKLMFYLVLAVLGLCVLGAWLISDWLEGSVWRMLIFWGAVMALTLFMMLLALYDMLAVVKEYRERKSRL